MTEAQAYNAAIKRYDSLCDDEKKLLSELQAATAALVSIGDPVVATPVLDRLKNDLVRAEKAASRNHEIHESIERELKDPIQFIGMELSDARHRRKNLESALDNARGESDKATAERTRLAKEVLELEDKITRWAREEKYKPSPLRKVLGLSEEHKRSELDNARAARDEIKQKLDDVRKAKDAALLDKAIAAPAHCDAAIRWSQAEIEKLKVRRAKLEEEQAELSGRFHELDERIRWHKSNIGMAVYTENWAQQIIEDKAAETVSN